MNWLKKHFFKISTVVLLLISAGAIFIAVKSSRLENSILLPPFVYSDLAQYGYEYVTVSGTLVGTKGGNVAYPLNTNEFTCDNSVKECRLIQAQVTSDSGYLATYKESFPIKSWDNNFIVFKTDPKGSQCATWTYRIDRIKKELIGVRERPTNYDQDSCLGLAMERFEVKLVDGFDVLSELRGYKE
jgi:hypothetical protein